MFLPVLATGQQYYFLTFLFGNNETVVLLDE